MANLSIHKPRTPQDSRLPPVGTVLRRKVGTREVLVRIEKEGFEYEGAIYNSLSAIAYQITGTRWNGFAFFGLRQDCARLDIAPKSWPTPRPLSGHLAEVPNLDPEMLPETLRPWVEDLAGRLEMPTDYPAAAVMVMLAGALGRRALIYPLRHDHSWAVTANLWGAIIGRSGVMKTPVLRAVMGPLQRRQALAMAIYESETDTYERQLLTYSKQKRNSRTVVATDDREGEIDWNPGPPAPPVCTRYVVNEATIEKLHVILKENPHGVLFVRDELGGWLRRLEQQGEGRDRAFFLESWNGDGDFTFDRVGRGLVYARHLCLSVLGGLQPARLESHLADAITGASNDDGFMQRFQVVVWPDIRDEWEGADRVPDTRAERKLEQIVDRFLQFSSEDPFRARFGDAAQEVFVAWRKQLEQKIRGGNLEPALESHLAKSRSLMPKLALIFHMAEEGVAEEVSSITPERAVAYCTYLEAHARRIYASVISRSLRLAANLGERLRAGNLGTSFKVADAYLQGWAGLDTPENIRRALTVLVDAGWLRPIRAGLNRNGRPGNQHYHVNPGIYTKR